MHLWPNKSIIKASKEYNVKKVLANRPKGLKDEEWTAIASEAKLNKLIILNSVPKESRKVSGPRRPDGKDKE